MKTTVSLLSFCCLITVLAAFALAEQDKKNYTFKSARAQGRIDSVKVQFKVAGEGIDLVDGKENREKLSVVCDIDYDEKTLEISSDNQGLSRSLRSYNRAEAQIKVGNLEFKPVLSPDRSLVVDEITPQTAVVFAPRGHLTSEELDLIKVPCDSLLMDRFLPDKPVAIGDSWEHSDKLMTQLLDLDEVGQTDVRSVLKEVTDKVARFEMNGKVSGAINGVNSEIEIQAKYRFILKTNRIDWLGMRIIENRRSSPVSDGINAVSIVQMNIVPLSKGASFSEAVLKDLPLRSTAELLQLSHVSKQGGWELNHDRNWHVCRDQQDVAVLRRIDNGDLIAQCNISSLASKAGKLITREEFQEDIKRALAKEFKEFVEAGQTTDTQNRRILRVVVRGTASDLPIVWNYYHIADQKGHQLGCVVTVEEKYLERLGKADQQLIESLRFTNAK